jgi:hypothetical protein
MVTLKSLSAFAILPQIDLTKVPEEFKASIAETVNSVLDSAFRETPNSVVDRCRDALTTLLSRWLVSKGHDRSILGEDLGKVAAAVAKLPEKMICASSLAQVVARLHSRGKGNEQYTKNLREPVEEDAALALHALGFILRDIGWAV